MTKPAESLIRISVRTLYDAQTLRIQTGNRIVAAFRDKLGIAPGESEEETPEAKKALDTLRAEYNRITDGVKRITRNTRPDSNLLTSPGEIRMIEAYDLQLKCEETHIKLIDSELGNYPIYTGFLKNVHGCGPLMAGVIISEIDIHKCNSISALWAYCGLDVVVHTDDNGEIREEGRSRKAHHLAPKTCTGKDGNPREYRGITFNPFLKTKLVGVLGGCFVKLGGPYRKIYDDYKHRLENHPKHTKKTKKHRHNMAVRYMIKEFLADLYREWRTLEGLPVRPRYAEEKLGIVHSQPGRKAA